MSETFEKVLGVKFLPIFPLPVVLMPNELMPLHIFEPRYRQMLRDIKLEKNLFGLSYFNYETADSVNPETGSIGCVAEVRESQTFDDGRSHILTTGLIRYTLEKYVEADENYLVAEVSFFEDDAENIDILKPLAAEVLELFARVAAGAQEISGDRARLPDFSKASPQEISFIIAAAFNFSADLKYQLLKTRSTTERLESLRLTLQKSVKEVEENAEIKKIAKTNGHSKKKITLDQ